MAREIQRHPVRGSVSHVDFQVVDPNKPVVTEVPLHFMGDAVEIRHADWEVDQQMFNLEVKARPDQIPTHIDVDISELKVGDSIHIEHLELPKGVEAVGDPSISVVTTRAGRVATDPRQAGGSRCRGSRRRRGIVRRGASALATMRVAR
jgi:large subunit ribosomal protein L25